MNHIRDPPIQARSHGGHSEAVPPQISFVPPQILLRPEKFVLKI